MVAQFLRSVNLSRHPAHGWFHLHVVGHYRCPDFYEIPVAVITFVPLPFRPLSLFLAKAYYPDGLLIEQIQAVERKE